MERILSTLTHAIGGSPGIALSAALAWGVLSVLLSPCHLASIPLIVGFVSGQGRVTVRRAFLLALLFSVGILVTIAAIGAITAAAGRIMGDIGRYGNWFVAAVFFLVGLHLIGVIPMPGGGPGQVGMRRRGLPAAFILGFVFGVALGPCTFAFMAPLLAVTFKLSAAAPVHGALLLVAYALGHCGVIVLAGTFTEAVQRYLDWNERSRGAIVVKQACGTLVLLGGLWMLYTAP